jgi:hypothetical protein
VNPDFHKPCPGQTETLCDLYINLLRGVIDHQQWLIADLQRRAAGQPVTWTWINGVLQDPEREETRGRTDS